MKKFLKRHWRKLVIAAVALPILAFLGVCLAIGTGVRGAVFDAEERYPGDPVTALISMATSEEIEIADRNRAIWALGQLGSPKALPTLQSMETDGTCDHDSSICQYELEKAIAGCSGGTNIGAVIWRHGDLAAAHKG